MTTRGHLYSDNSSYEKRTKLNEKEDGIGPFFNQRTLTYFVGEVSLFS